MGIAGILRGPKKGLSTLGGLVRVFLLDVDQFVADAATDWPNRSLITSGKVSGTIPLVVTDPVQKAARIQFDIATAKFSSAGRTTTTQFSHKHTLTGKIAGYTAEQAATVEEMVGKHYVVIAERANGDKVVLGTVFRPMMLEISADGGENGDGYVGRDIKFEQTDVCDFQPPILGTSATFTANTIPSWPA